MEQITYVKKQLGKKFHMFDLGPLNYFLGLKFCILQGILYFSVQTHDLIVSSGITDNRTTVIPMDLHLH